MKRFLKIQEYDHGNAADPSKPMKKIMVKRKTYLDQNGIPVADPNATRKQVRRLKSKDLVKNPNEFLSQARSILQEHLDEEKIDQQQRNKPAEVVADMIDSLN